MRVNSVVTAALLGAVGIAGGSSAAIVASYDAGVSPTAGTTGAADPTGQGWAVVTNATASAWKSGMDSTIGGWRIVDATTGGFFYYQNDLSVDDAALMAGNDWTASWTVAVSRDAVRNDGVPNGVDNFFNGGANSPSNQMWIEVAGSFRYILTHTADSNNDIQIRDGVTTFQVTTDGGNLSDELGEGAPFAKYVTFTLSYDAGTDAATLSDDQGNNHGVISTSGTAGLNRVVWGGTGATSQGSTVWNNIEVDVVPEPGSLALLGLGGLLIARRRR